jgi:two-component system cell cycle sensor histidine kinase/response regulator CckA
MQSVSQLRHSMHTALNHIIGYAEMLLDEARTTRSSGAWELENVASDARRLGERIRSALTAPPRHTERMAVYDEIKSFGSRTKEALRKSARTSPELREDLSKIETAAANLETIALDLFAAPAINGAEEIAPLPRTGSARILAVDDDAGNREILKRQLERQGYLVETAGSGDEALQVVRRESFDVILLDIVMPGLDGFHVLQEIRSDADLAGIPVVMLSALDELESVARCLEMGASDFLSKPFDPRLLRARIESLLSRRQAEVERSEMAESLRLLLESTAEGIFGLDEKGNCTFINAAGCKLLGYDRDELLGKPIQPLLHAAAINGLPRAAEGIPMDQAVRAGRFVRVRDESFRRKDGSTIPVEYSANPLFRDGEVRGAVITFSDISDRRRAEEHMRQAAKLESLGVLAGGIAHDFNNLLTGVLGNASLLRSALETDDPNGVFADEIITASERAADLTAQLLAYAGKGMFIIKPIDLSELVGSLTALIHSSIPRKASIDFCCSGEVLVDGDRAQIQQVIMNLVINAGEALTEGAGSVRITTGIQEMESVQAAQPDPLPPGRYVFLEVADSGRGMRPDVKNRIFDPFFSTKFLGRGLGLAATLGIVRAHQGGIVVESAPEEGSVFRVYFPPSRAAAAAQEPAPPERSLVGTETVLIVDDEDTVRKTASRALQQFGYRVLTASDGREAVTLLGENSRAVSVVLLDMTMPGMSGAETARYLRTIRPNIPILVTSGYDEHEVKRQFVPHGFAGFIRKPYRADQLVEAVRRVLKGSALSAEGTP